MKVLIVDDDPNIVQMVKINLELDAMVVETASNGIDGIEKAKAFKPDVILMDWMMPEMTGIDALKIIRKDGVLSGIPVFMLTAKSQVADMDKAIGEGADNYITKPFDPVTLSELIVRKVANLRKTAEPK